MPSDFSHLKNSGSSCVGCGVTSDRRKLLRLNTYARSLGCYQCWSKYKACANENPMGVKCGHDPTEHLKIGDRLCRMPGCGCQAYRHGLESELDRQFAASVGKEATTRECTGFGINTGKCGRMALAKPDGSVGRLCDRCEDTWIRETIQASKEAAALMDIDPKDVEMPH